MRKLLSQLDLFLKKIKIDENLGGIRTKKFFKNLIKGLRIGLDEQTENFVYRSGFFPNDLFHKFASGKSSDVMKQSVDAALDSLVFYVEVDLVFDALIEAANIGGQSFLEKAKLDGVFILTNQDITNALKARQTMLIGSTDPMTGKILGKGLLDETTRDHLAGILSRGFEEGLSEFEIKEELLKKMKNLNPMRAELIAHAEIANAVHSMELEAAIRNGATQKRWITSHDARVTPECMANERQDFITVTSEFLSGHQSPPRFPRCRCHLEYQYSPLDQIIWTGK